MSEITYANANDPKCRGLRVFNRRTGVEIRDVVEVNASEGWLLKCKRDGAGELVADNGKLATQFLKSDFVIRCPEECE